MVLHRQKKFGLTWNGGTASSIGIWDEDEQAGYWFGLGFTSATANIASVNAAQADGGLGLAISKRLVYGVIIYRYPKAQPLKMQREELKRIPLSVMHRITNLLEMGVMTL